MSSTSKSKSKSYGPKVKQPIRNWLEVPSDIMVNILQRVGVVDILENAQKVCTAWRKICKDPAMWRIIYMDRFSDSRGKLVFREMCKNAVDRFSDERQKRVFREMCKNALDRSQGQLLDLTIVDFCNYWLLQDVSDRSRQLRRLEIILCSYGMYDTWSNPLKKLPLLEELSLVRTYISPQDIKAAGKFCPLLKTLKLNRKPIGSLDYDGDVHFDGAFRVVENGISLAIGKNLRWLTHLELIGNKMDNIGLEAILDGCCNLESLDLRRCKYLDLKGDLGKRCSHQIKFLKLPNDSLEGCPHTAYFSVDFYDDDSDAYPDYDDESDDGYDYEDELSERMAFMFG